MSRPLIIGVGNRMRGDDQVGLSVSEALAKSLETHADVAYCTKDVMSLLELWKSREQVFVLDALLTGAKPPGFVHSFLVNSDPIPAEYCQTSTHVLDVVQVIELSSALGTLPPTLKLYGIEARSFKLGSGLTKELEDQLPAATSWIEADIRQTLKLGNSPHA